MKKSDTLEPDLEFDSSPDTEDSSLFLHLLWTHESGICPPDAWVRLEGKVTVGRKYRFPGMAPLTDPYLSGEHFSLNARAGGISFRNHSRHGTYVNGRKFEEQTLVLQEGDVLLAGKSVFALVSGGPAGELKTPGEIVGASEAMRSIISRLPDIASGGRTVLLHGETGTGKTFLAKQIHELSRRVGELVEVNCASLPELLVESTLFGSTKGAFTGAEERPGLVEEAEGGTLLLDEIGELPLPAQAKLLHFLETGSSRRLGATKLTEHDVRIIAATNRAFETDRQTDRRCGCVKTCWPDWNRKSSTCPRYAAAS